MNKSAAFILAALTTLGAASAAHADDADPSQQFAHPVTTERARADVVAEAVQRAATFSPEPAGSRIAAPLKSPAARAAVQGDAALALRDGRISYGEAGGRQS